MPSGNQNFDIAEVDPSPERPQRSPENNALRARPEDVPLQSVEVDATAGLCHECPIFAGTSTTSVRATRSVPIYKLVQRCNERRQAMDHREVRRVLYAQLVSWAKLARRLWTG